ncbi:transcriptional regulator, MarR family [Sulfobacillus acidophilus DSM 10332]|uniref:Transcriptional regulator, MarR family n=1 Tax=Sulfobacillus acidophilus (strain ATCC 700253 / DSM 10332 / NAL) TaxID=679936 RepID=G8TSZ7_SULAD|nr:transcriptional regulator, MarR family [Sulfobacillus acidophilus DSM 10332]MCY0865809.1 ROK family transcriptional regulator [Sulfobacillus sp.]
MPISVARHSLMRKMNEIAVLTVVRRHAPISRRRIAEITGLTKSTVTVAVQRLFSKNILMELGSVSTGPGRPEIMLGLNPQAGYILGAAIDVATYQILLFDLEAHILSQKTVSYDPNASPETVLEQIAKDAEAVRREIPHEHYWGFGVSIPGIISPTGDVVYAPNLKWSHVPVRAHLLARLGEPVYVVNDADAGAVAEYYFGEAQQSEILLYVSLGIGIGGGAVLGGNLLQGTTGAGTEIGHMVIVDNGPYCRCGRRGCFEAVASVRALVERAMRARDVWQWMSLDQILAGYAQNEPWAVQAVDETMHYLEQGMVNIANIFDPDTLILGGPLARLGEMLRARIAVRLHQDTIAPERREIAVRLTSLGEFTSALGAGAMVLDTAVSREES